MDLLNFLRLIFPNKSPDEYDKMIDNIIKLGLTNVKDLAYLDEHAINNLKDFTHYEAKKLIDWATNPDPENFDLLLLKIFEEISYDRFQETKVHLDVLKVKNRNDLLSITENQLNDGFFSESETKKIERFLELNSDKLEHTLKKILSETPRNRLKMIYQVLKEQEVYSGKDILLVNTTELRKNGSLSEPEISKIEQHIKENQMDLKNFLKKIFPDREDAKYSNFIEDLKKTGIDFVQDLKYLNVETGNCLKSFNYIEISKLIETYSTFNNEDFKTCLRSIFNGFPETKLMEIESFLNDQSIFSQKDLLYANTNKLKKCKSLSDNEIIKIERYIEKHNAEHYKKIMHEKSLELSSALNEIFLGVSEKRIQEIEVILRKHDITARKDLILFDVISFKKLLTNGEITKIETYLEINHKEQYDKVKAATELEKYDPSNLDHVVNNIFSGTPAQRLEKIIKLLNNEEIYNGTDVLTMDTNILREKRSFSEAEVLKIEEYIRKNNPKKYEEIIASKRMKDDMKSVELKGKKEIELFSLKQTEELKFLELKLQNNMQIKALEMEAHKEKERLECDKMKQEKQMEIDRLKLIQENEIKLAEIQQTRITKRHNYQFLDKEKKELQRQVFQLEQERTQFTKTIAQIEAGWSYIGMAKDLEGAKTGLRETRKLLQEKESRIEAIEQELQTLST